MSEFFYSDEYEGKAYDTRLLKRLFQFVRPFLTLAIIGVVLGMFAAGVRILMPLLQGMVVADLSPDQQLESSFLEWMWTLIGSEKPQGVGAYLPLLAFLFAITISLRFVLQISQHYILQIFGQKVIYEIRVQLFEHLLKLPMQYFHKNPVGRLVTRISNDIESLNEFVANGLMDITRHFFLVLAISLALPIIAWRLGLIALALLPLVIIVSAVFRYFARRAYRDLRKYISKVNAFLAENIAGMYVIRAFSREEEQKKRFDKLNEDLQERYITSIRTWALYSPTVSFFEGLGLAVILYFGHNFVTGGTLDLPTLSIFIWTIGLYFEPIRHLAEKYNLLQSAMASSERIFKIFDTEIDSTYRQNYDRPWEGPPKGKIDFEGIRFGYEEDNPVLRDFNLEINPGQKVALVGHTGAGKSTVVRLLLRYYDPQKGRILVDGRELTTIPPRQWRKHLALVPQDVFLFLGTIGDNIGLWNEDLDEKTIHKAAQNVHAHRFIEDFEEGYDHQLKEGAKTLSSGQRQLLSFARALAYDPAILILDEATALIDTQTEKLIQDALETLTKGRTTIIIAHRLSTIEDADKIVVLKKGRIAEVGTHQELLAQRGVYYGLYQLQYSR